MKTIMVVDDDSMVREAVSRSLRIHLGEVDIRKMAHGREALEFLQVVEEGDLPHIVVTDCDMPFLNGFELIEEMRKDPRLAQIKIVVCSGDEGNGMIARSMGLPFFHKGNRTTDLLSLVDPLL